jgi:hypothetical protein
MGEGVLKLIKNFKCIVKGVLSTIKFCFKKVGALCEKFFIFKNLRPKKNEKPLKVLGPSYPFQMNHNWLQF